LYSKLNRMKNLQKYTKENFYGHVTATTELRDKVYDKISDTDTVINFAYTDYGGDFFDKVCVEYFSENYPDNFVWEHSGWNGKNGILFGEVADKFFEETSKYLLGFEDIESTYYELERETENESFVEFLEDLKHEYEFDHDKCLSWLIDNQSGYYSVYPWGLDFDYQKIKDLILEENLITKK